MFLDNLKDAGVTIHVVATGAGTAFQDALWQEPGSSAYLSGASFPYSPEEQEEVLGFEPEHFCSEEAAVDLASAAYMKAYKFGGKRPVGIGITASVASEKEHRGDHRIHACLMTDYKVRTVHKVLAKGIGYSRRALDNSICSTVATDLLMDGLGLSEYDERLNGEGYSDATQLAVERFEARPLFLSDGKRLNPKDFKISNSMWALMPGAFNPPHAGHIGLADTAEYQFGVKVIFEVCVAPPHKSALSVQGRLQRAKLLKGHPTLFTHLPMYLDKAKVYPNTPMVVGADAMLRLLDPKWGIPTDKLVKKFQELGTEFIIGGRLVDDKLITAKDIRDMVSSDFAYMFRGIKGQWDISSTEIRDKAL